MLSGLESGTGSITFSPIGLGSRPAGLVAGGGWNGKLIIWDVAVSGATHWQERRLTLGQTGHTVHESEIAEEIERQSTRDKPMMVCTRSLFTS